ncbi:hypothetical protein AAFC00_005856 [Neodothiora populina]|uniref:NADP-dependent oxidoreductase domain-containing protein n=1 Tax=Neodothiora populina TaxID=2781224 RepID=A0ABR3P635_9PEZI
MHLLCAFLATALTSVHAQSLDTQVPLQPLTLAEIPHLGFGTWNLQGKNATKAVCFALQAGYRHIDAAAIYRNEPYVGKGIADGLSKAGLKRSDIWVTSKLWNDHHAPDKVEAGIDKTLTDLGLEYLDLYHMHWPVAANEHGYDISFLQTWEAMVQLLQSGKTRNIGIANFSPAQLELLLNSTTHPPSAHQMELHPYLQQKAWIEFHEVHGIHVTAYSPLAGSNPIYNGEPAGGPPQLLRNEDFIKIGNKHDCTPAQVALAWGLSRGTSVIPKSAHPDRISENFDSPSCELDEEDYEVIADIGMKLTHRYNNPSRNWGLKLYEGLEDS